MEPQVSAGKAAMIFGKPGAFPPPPARAVFHAGEYFHLLGPYTSNWYHSVVDQLSLISRWQSEGLRERGVKLIAPGFWNHRWPGLLKLFGVGEEEVLWFDGSPVRLEALHVPFGVRVVPRAFLPSGRTRQTFANPFDVLGLRGLIIGALEASRPVAGGGGGAVIDRSDSARLPRTKTFGHLAERLVRDHGFDRIVMGRLRPEEQFAVFRDYPVVIAEHGAGMTSMIAAGSDTSVVEILPKDASSVSAHGFNFLANSLRHRKYHTLVESSPGDLLSYVEEKVLC